MLPTQGLFKDIECPYNENACGRPYCHFRHRKKPRSQPEEELPVPPEVPTYNPTPKSQLVRHHIPISYVPNVIVRKERPLLHKPTYKPTPLAILSSANANKDKDVDNDKDSSEKKEVEEQEEEEKYQVEEQEEKYEPEVVQDCLFTNEDFVMIDEILNDPGVPVIEESAQKKGSSKSSRTEEKARHKSKKSHKSASSRASSSNSSKRIEDKSKSKSKHRDKEKERERKRRKEKEKEKQKKRKPKAVVEVTYVPTSKADLLQLEEQSDQESLFGDDVEQECYKIFQEYQPEPKASLELSLDLNVGDKEVEPYVPAPKKRVAYQNAQESKQTLSKFNSNSNSNSAAKRIPDPAQIMTNRFKIARQAQSSNEQANLMAELNKQRHQLQVRPKKIHAEPQGKPRSIKVKASTSTSKQPAETEGVSVLDSILSGAQKTTTTYAPGVLQQARKRKINPVSNMANMLRAKAKVEELQKRKASDLALSKTPVQTAGKGSKRTAHVPDSNLSLTELPDVLHFDKSKLPVNVRTRYLTLMADETVKLYLCRENAYQRALEEEFKVYERCSALMTYRNSAMLAVNRIRKELQEREVNLLGPYEPDEVGGSKANGDKSGLLRGKQFYERVKKYLLTEVDLVENGYPRESDVAGRAVIKSKFVPRGNVSENQRECARCMRNYFVDRRGFPVREEECIYHPLRKRTFRGESYYLCCKSSAEVGCVTSNTHVSEDVDGKLLEGFQVQIRTCFITSEIIVIILE